MEHDADWSNAVTAFEEFVVARSPALLRTAWLLTGNEASAQDLVQTALMMTWARWSRVVRRDAPEAYVRRAMVSTFLTWRRRRWVHEQPVAEPELDGGTADETNQVVLRMSVQASLRALTKGQRAVVVLRYFDDLSESETAALMGCSVGTVKSQMARAMARLRADPRLGNVWEGRYAQ